MADKDDTSKVRPGRNQSASEVSPSGSAKRSTSGGDRTETSSQPKSNERSYTDPRSRLEQTIEAQREQLLQAHGVLTCLYEVLLYAEGEDAVAYAQAAHVVASLISKSVENLDITRLAPMIYELTFGGGYKVEEPTVLYLT